MDFSFLSYLLTDSTRDHRRCSSLFLVPAEEGFIDGFLQGKAELRDPAPVCLNEAFAAGGFDMKEPVASPPRGGLSPEEFPQIPDRS
ncbi:hypothetical protein JQ628_23870 [Bradyrhizobium lablabi]|uniref:hypothetical protein n=1 Tax=Bradyrhizobium lablabi TaxID=722472 RepID=UPI001BADC5F5|nr:hypothetical protein [Bradyrhizobium lablabi]MBR1124582.1 hypothetical protein [Bradyrhizobium lablabi]